MIGWLPRLVRPRRATLPTVGSQLASLAFQARSDMRAALPLGLTPHQRDAFLRWMLDYGQHEIGFSETDARLAIEHVVGDPSHGLTETYLLQPSWQNAVPHGLTIFGWADLKRWLVREYQLSGAWLDKARLTPRFRPWEELQLALRAHPKWRATFPRDCGLVLNWLNRHSPVSLDRRWRNRLKADIRAGLPTRSAVTVLGLFRYTSGLQQAACGMVEALNRAGVHTDLRDVPGPAIREFPTAQPLDRVELADVTIIHTGLDMSVPEAFARAGLAPRSDVHRVAMWWWELEQLPAEWHDRGRDVDEIWAPTRFIADALRPLGKPVLLMPPGIELPRFAPRGKVAFGMSPERFTFAVLFDANSRLQRKNPVAAVQAFRRAFRREEPVELVLKMTPPVSSQRPEIVELRALCEEAGVRLIEAIFSREETLAFLAAADSVVSLHRSEGFGLPLAEAMLLGKPVIATGYSGNMDFMTPNNSFPVQYERVPIAADDPPYRQGFLWAEPTVGHAAELMRRVFDRSDEARAVGSRASRELKQQLSVEAAGQRMRARLAEIAASREGRR